MGDRSCPDLEQGSKMPSHNRTQTTPMSPVNFKTYDQRKSSHTKRISGMATPAEALTPTNKQPPPGVDKLFTDISEAEENESPREPQFEGNYKMKKSRTIVN